MKKSIYITILFILLLSGAFSQEIVMSTLGYTDFGVEGKNKTECEDYPFSIPLSYLEGNEYPIFSVKATFFPELDESAKITLNFNDTGAITTWAEDFYCNNNVCWARPIISRSRLQKDNIVDICSSTTNITSRIVVFSGSKIGFYETPIFTIEKTAPEQIFIGDKAEMKIIAKNLGSKDANVFIQFISPIGKKVVNIDSFDIVEGESTARALIKAGDTKEFVYYIKPTLESSYNLPAAVLFFENIFGEEQHLYSNHPMLDVVKPERTEIFIVGSTPEDNKFTFKVVVKNLWNETFKGQLRISHEEHVEGALSEITIPPNGEREFEFKTDTLPIGEYNFYALVEDENTSLKSDSITFMVETEDLPEGIYFAIVGIIVAVVLFAIIFVFWKEAKS